MAWQLKQSLASKHRRGGTSVSFFILKSRLGTVLQSLLVYTSVCLIHKTKQPSVFYHITLYWAHWGLEPIPGSFGWDTPSPPHIHVFGLSEESGVPRQKPRTHTGSRLTPQKSHRLPQGIQTTAPPWCSCRAPKAKAQRRKKDLNLISYIYSAQ